jgi:hypothetical protein
MASGCALKGFGSTKADCSHSSNQCPGTSLLCAPQILDHLYADVLPFVLHAYFSKTPKSDIMSTVKTTNARTAWRQQGVVGD